MWQLPLEPQRLRAFLPALRAVPGRPQVAQLREELAQRNLKAQGTKQILLARLTEVRGSC